MNNIKPINFDNNEEGFWNKHPRLREYKWAVEDFFHKLYSPFYRFKSFVVKVCKYLPILWRDRDFDWVFIMTLFKFKLKMTREYLVKENIIGDIESISAQIKQAEDMIEAILEDDFCKEENAAHELKWGEHNDYFTPTENGCSLWNFSRTKANTPEEKEQEHKEIMEIYALSDKRQEEMWDKLFAHLRANIMSWWS